MRLGSNFLFKKTQGFAFRVFSVNSVSSLELVHPSGVILETDSIRLYRGQTHGGEMSPDEEVQVQSASSS